jgi:quercetin 2,3-dioxygenase
MMVFLIKVVAGEVYGVMGAVKEIYAESEYLDITVPEGISFKHQISSDKQAFIYVFKGLGTIGDGKDQIQISATS